jgi:hypothetical protein
MLVRGLSASILALAIASPAFADCATEVEALASEVTTSETGAAAGAMPATPHQTEVLEGSEQAGQGTSAGITDDSTMPASPHQQEARRDMDTDNSASMLVSEASELAAAGDETGCMQKLDEAKELLGMN